MVTDRSQAERLRQEAAQEEREQRELERRRGREARRKAAIERREAAEAQRAKESNPKPAPAVPIVAKNVSATDQESERLEQLRENKRQEERRLAEAQRVAAGVRTGGSTDAAEEKQKAEQKFQTRLKKSRELNQRIARDTLDTELRENLEDIRVEGLVEDKHRKADLKKIAAELRKPDGAFFGKTNKKVAAKLERDEILTNSQAQDVFSRFWSNPRSDLNLAAIRFQPPAQIKGVPAKEIAQAVQSITLLGLTRGGKPATKTAPKVKISFAPDLRSVNRQITTRKNLIESNRLRRALKLKPKPVRTRSFAKPLKVAGGSTGSGVPTRLTRQQATKQSALPKPQTKAAPVSRVEQAAAQRALNVQKAKFAEASRQLANANALTRAQARTAFKALTASGVAITAATAVVNPSAIPKTQPGSEVFVVVSPGQATTTNPTPTPTVDFQTGPASTTTVGPSATTGTATATSESVAVTPAATASPTTPTTPTTTPATTAATVPTPTGGGGGGSPKPPTQPATATSPAQKATTAAQPPPKNTKATPIPAPLALPPNSDLDGDGKPDGRFPRKVQWRQGIEFKQFDLETSRLTRSKIPAPGGVRPGRTPAMSLKVIKRSTKRPKVRSFRLGAVVADVKPKAITFRKFRGGFEDKKPPGFKG